MTDIWAVLSGGVAGSIVTLFGQRIITYCIAPELHIDFGEDRSGCRVRTPAMIDGNEVEQHYLRLRIRNNGWSTAKNVSVVVTGIAVDDQEFDEEVLDLHTSISAKLTFDIGRKGYRFVDLFHLVRELPAVGAMFDFVATPIRFRRISAERHSFSA